MGVVCLSRHPPRKIVVRGTVGTDTLAHLRTACRRLANLCRQGLVVGAQYRCLLACGFYDPRSRNGQEYPEYLVMEKVF